MIQVLHVCILYVLLRPNSDIGLKDLFPSIPFPNSQNTRRWKTPFPFPDPHFMDCSLFPDFVFPILIILLTFFAQHSQCSPITAIHADNLLRTSPRYPDENTSFIPRLQRSVR